MATSLSPSSVTGLIPGEGPPPSIPLRHFAFSAAAFWVFAAAFAWAPERLLGFGFQARWALGLVHILTLGWITMTMFGALLQMMPVLWRISLGVPRLLLSTGWWLFAVGILGFVGHLWMPAKEYGWPAVLVAAAFVFYLSIFIRAMARAPERDEVWAHLVFAFGYLALLAAMGVLLAFDRGRGLFFPDPDGALIAHIHLALVGWVSLTVFGVSYRLVSMFALAHGISKKPGIVALILVNAGLVALALDALWGGRHWMRLWSVAIVLGYSVYAFQMRSIFSLRTRRLDPALSHTLLALGGGALWAGLGLALTFGWLPDTTETRAAYVSAALLGWITPYILGQIQKIVPFLVWMEVFNPLKPGRPTPTPRMQDLTSEKLGWAQFAGMAAAIPTIAGGFLWESLPALRAGSLLLLAAATVYAVNMGLTLSCLFGRRPKRHES